MSQPQQPKDKEDLQDKVKKYQQMSNKLSQVMLDMLRITEESKLLIWKEMQMKLSMELDKRHQEIVLDIQKIQKDMNNASIRHRPE